MKYLTFKTEKSTGRYRSFYDCGVKENAEKIFAQFKINIKE